MNACTDRKFGQAVGRMVFASRLLRAQNRVANDTLRQLAEGNKVAVSMRVELFAAQGLRSKSTTKQLHDRFPQGPVLTLSRGTKLYKFRITNFGAVAALFLSYALMTAPIEAQQAAPVTYSFEAGVVYGEGLVTKEGKAVSRDLWMDVYHPTETVTTPRPAVILTFGGAFHRGSPRLTFQSGGAQDTSMGNYCRRFAARGYTCFAIDYRLTPEGPVPSGEGYQTDWIEPDSLLPLLPQANHIRETMDLPPLDFSNPEQERTMVDSVISAAEDLRKAVLHIREFADTYEIDPNRIALGGFSAGAVTSWNVAHGMGIPVSGVFLLSGTDAGFDVNKAVTASSNRPPILMFMGQYDLAGALSSVPQLIAHYKKVGVDYEFAWVPGFGHFYPAGAASLGSDAVSMSVEGRMPSSSKASLARDSIAQPISCRRRLTKTYALVALSDRRFVCTVLVRAV